MEFENSICGRGRVGYHGESFVSICFDVLLYFIGGLVNSCTVSVCLFTDADAGLEDGARDSVFVRDISYF